MLKRVASIAVAVVEAKEYRRERTDGKGKRDFRQEENVSNKVCGTRSYMTKFSYRQSDCTS